MYIVQFEKVISQTLSSPHSLYDSRHAIQVHPLTTSFSNNWLKNDPTAGPTRTLPKIYGAKKENICNNLAHKALEI